MDLIEGEHFHVIKGYRELTDEEAIRYARGSFINTIRTMDDNADLDDYVQTRIIE